MVIGLILLAAAVVAAVELVLANQEPITLRMWNGSWTFDAYWLAVVGAAIVVVALVGLAMMRIGGTRMRRLRRERRELAAENRRLSAQAERADSGEFLAPMPPPTDGAYADGAQEQVVSRPVRRR